MLYYECAEEGRQDGGSRPTRHRTVRSDVGEPPFKLAGNRRCDHEVAAFGNEHICRNVVDQTAVDERSPAAADRDRYAWDVDALTDRMYRVAAVADDRGCA